VRGPTDDSGRLSPARPGGQYPLAVAVAVSGAFVRSPLMELGTDDCKDLGLKQVLEASPHDLRDQGASGGALHEVVQLGGDTMGEGHGLCSV
jgi:hypothetical protein